MDKNKKNEIAAATALGPIMAIREKGSSVERMNIIALKDDAGRVTGFVIKTGSNVEFYQCSPASYEEIEELLKAIQG